MSRSLTATSSLVASPRSLIAINDLLLRLLFPNVCPKSMSRRKPRPKSTSNRQKSCLLPAFSTKTRFWPVRIVAEKHTRGQSKRHEAASQKTLGIADDRTMANMEGALPQNDSASTRKARTWPFENIRREGLKDVWAQARAGETSLAIYHAFKVRTAAKEGRVLPISAPTIDHPSLGSLAGIV